MKYYTTEQIMDFEKDGDGWSVLSDGRRVKLGEGVVLGNGASIGNGSNIGKFTIIGMGSSIFTDKTG